MSHSINPHQLDCDWRFDRQSRCGIAEFVSPNDRVLLLGCPTLMDMLKGKIRRGVLLERNPIHLPVGEFAVSNCDLRFPETIPSFQATFDIAVIDAPWYPNDLRAWLSVAINLTRSNGAIFFVLWPESTRPGAAEEHRAFLSELAALGIVERVGSVSYDMPLFERLSLQETGAAEVLRSGLLYRLIKGGEGLYQHAYLRASAGLWRRFSIFGEQLAIRVPFGGISRESAFQFDGAPFVLRSTSRRDPVLETINVWTSKNVVARLKNPLSFADGILARSSSHIDFLQNEFQISGAMNEPWGISWEHHD